ncbi:MAG: UDP-N-acetylglucosamine pyrophosphorylase [Clostridiales bacterium]|nr:UDP-N-acetylglucosamine pyrophosphorylase [Clostridiales bacterium]
MNKQVRTSELFSCTTEYLVSLFDSCEYPWEMLPKINDYIISVIKNGITGYITYSDNVLIGENVKIYPTATIEGPAIIGSNSEVRPGAFIRGNVITGENCVLGNSSEFKNCILLKNVQAPHYNYVGDSVLGNFCHLGAATVCSNLKSDKKAVVIHGDEDYNTGLRKVGAILADYADVGSGCVLNPGTVIGRNTSVYPGNTLRGVFPGGSIIKSMSNIVIKR